MHLTPSEVRKSGPTQSNTLQLQLYYRPPYDWVSMQKFLALRLIPQLEWCDKKSYGRTFEWAGSSGFFTVEHVKQDNKFNLEIDIDDISKLSLVVNNIRRVLDLDVDIQAVEKDLKKQVGACLPLKNGLRIPGIWSVFEAGVRAILGQQVSVAAARKLVSSLVENLGRDIKGKRLFPTPESIKHSELDFIKMPGARKNTLRALAQYYLEHEISDDPQQWLALKGIGPWSVNYARLRGLSEPDIYLGGDLGVKKAMTQMKKTFNPDQASPWRSYLTFQLWNQL